MTCLGFSFQTAKQQQRYLLTKATLNYEKNTSCCSIAMPAAKVPAAFSYPLLALLHSQHPLLQWGLHIQVWFLASNSSEHPMPHKRTELLQQHLYSSYQTRSQLSSDVTNLCCDLRSVGFFHEMYEVCILHEVNKSLSKKLLFLFLVPTPWQLLYACPSIDKISHNLNFFSEKTFSKKTF